jgi:hypothetical protein
MAHDTLSSHVSRFASHSHFTRSICLCGRNQRGRDAPRGIRLACPRVSSVDGTDPAVADFKQVEIELQPLGRLRDDQQTSLVAPAFRYNYGFAERWEYVVEGQVEQPVSPTGPPSLTATDFMFKTVPREGTLQDKSGPSAIEFGPLLPGINADPGVGFSATGIVSQRFDWATVHFNIETNLGAPRIMTFFRRIDRRRGATVILAHSLS